MNGMTDESTSIGPTGRRLPQAGADMPTGVRRGLLGLMAVLAAGALYLVIVRGEALLADLGALGRLVLCL
jgi:hypothetical protein